MMKFKKSMTILAVLSMVAVILAGCGQKQNTKNNKPDETSNVEEKVVATIGDETVTTGDLSIFLRQIEMQYEGMFGPDVWDQKVEGEKTVLELAKENALKTAEDIAIIRLIAKKEGIEIPEEEIKKMDEAAPNLIEQFGEDSGITLEAVDRVLRSEYYRNELFESKLADYTIDKKELDDILKSNPNYAKYLDNTPEELAKQVRARHILISTMDENRQPLPEEEANKKKAEAEKVLEKVNAGEDFATLAKEYSEDPGSKDNGGEYTFARGQMVKEFEDAAFSQKPGEVSGLVQTSYGYHIIKTEEIIEPTEEDIKAVTDQKKALEDQAEEQLKMQEFQKRFDEWKKDYEIKENPEVIATVEIRQSRNQKPEEEAKPEDNGAADDQTADDQKADDTTSTDDKPADENADKADDKNAE